MQPGRKEQGKAEKGTEDAVVRMQFGHWVPLLVHTQARKPFSHSEAAAFVKMEVFVTQEILKVFVPSLVVLVAEKHCPQSYKE